VYLPAAANAAVTESGKPVEGRREDGEYVVDIGSGEYDFSVK
jgi:hypothetical protein